MTEPFRIGYLCPDEDDLALPDTMVSAEAARDLVNGRGGIHGRPLELLAGTDGGDPERAVALARDWAAAGVMTVTGTSTVWGQEPLDVMAEAGIVFTGAAIDLPSYVHPASRPFIGGAAAELMLLAEVTAERANGGAVGVVHADVEMAATAVSMLMEQPLRQAGVENVVTAPARDGFGAAVEELGTADPAVIVGLCEATDAAEIVRSAHEFAPGAQVVFTGACLDEARLFEPIGELADGLILTAAFWPYTDLTHPQVAEFRAALGEDFRPSAFAQGGFAAIMTVAAILERLGPDVTAADVFGHLDTTDDQQIYMQTHLSPTKASPLFPSLHNLDTLVLQRKGGEFVDIGSGWRVPAALSM